MNELDEEDIALIIYSLEAYKFTLEWSTHRDSVRRVLEKVQEIQLNN